jgi:hemerythrin-like domain-containing protein
MKRHDALIPLSHDHQHALAQALRLQRSADGDLATQRATLAEFLQFTDASIETHFAEEELVLERAVETSGAPVLRAARDQMLAEHAWLRAKFVELRRMAESETEAGFDSTLLRETGERLTAHVRYEERELFELLQTELGEQLTELVGDDVAPRT